ncbi:uncharacterized protein [Periplaneta americana]|uniref:uncharacterized protein n=1 Tax=Periplaneta americana TaxID=6978 RepID=UPI0037E78C3B
MCKMLGLALILVLCVSATAQKFEGALQRSGASYHRNLQHPEVRRYHLMDMGMTKNLDRLRSDKLYGKEYEHTFDNSNQASPSTPELPIWSLYNSNAPKGNKAGYQRDKKLLSFSAEDFSNHFKHDVHGNQLDKKQATGFSDDEELSNNWPNNFKQDVHGNHLYKNLATGFPDDKELSNNWFNNNQKRSGSLHRKDSRNSATPLVRFEDFRNSPTQSMDNDSQTFDTRKAHLSQDQPGFPGVDRLPHQTNSPYNSTMEEAPGKFPSGYQKIPDTEELYIVKGQVKKFKNIYELLRSFLPSAYKNSNMGAPLKPEDDVPKERMAYRVGDFPKPPFLSYNQYLPLPSSNWRQTLPSLANSNQAPQGSFSQPLAGVPPVYKRPINYDNLIQLSTLVPQFPDQQKWPQGFVKDVKCLLYRRNGKALHPVWIPYHPSMNARGSNKVPDNCFIEGPIPTLPPLPVVNTKPYKLATGEQEEVDRKDVPGIPLDKEEEVSQTTIGILGLPGNVEQKAVVNKEILAQPGTVEEEEVSQETPLLPKTVEEEEVVKNIPEQEQDILNVRQYYG